MLGPEKELGWPGESRDVLTCRTYRLCKGGVEQVAGVACRHSGVVRILLPVHHRHGQHQSSVLVAHQQRGATEGRQNRIY